MVDLEERLRRHAAAQLDAAEPVSADEARARAESVAATGSLPTRWLALAAAVLVVAGAVAALNVRDGDRGQLLDTGPAHSLTLDGHRDFHIQVLNGERVPTDDELEARYTDSFLAAVPPETFRTTRGPLVGLAPWRVLEEVERRDETVLATQLQAADGTQVRLTMHRTADGRLDASTILRVQPCEPAVAKDAALDPALRAQLDWLLESFAAGEDPSDAELQDRFAPSFLAAVSPALLRAEWPKVRSLAPYVLRHYEGAPSPLALTARLGIRTGEEARLTLSIESDAPHRITRFSILTALPCSLDR